MPSHASPSITANRPSVFKYADEAKLRLLRRRLLLEEGACFSRVFNPASREARRKEPPAMRMGLTSCYAVSPFPSSMVIVQVASPEGKER